MRKKTREAIAEEVSLSLQQLSESLRSLPAPSAPPESSSSSPTSPTPSTRPTPSSDETPTSILMEMMRTIRDLTVESQRETRALVMDILQGREQPTGPRVTEQIATEPSTSSDYDSIPLSPAIQAVLEREEEETNDLTLQQLLLTERRLLQERLASVQGEIRDQSVSEASWAGPLEPTVMRGDVQP